MGSALAGERHGQEVAERVVRAMKRGHLQRRQPAVEDLEFVHHHAVHLRRVGADEADAQVARLAPVGLLAGERIDGVENGLLEVIDPGLRGHRLAVEEEFEPRRPARSVVRHHEVIPPAGGHTVRRLDFNRVIREDVVEAGRERAVVAQIAQVAAQAVEQPRRLTEERPAVAVGEGVEPEADRKRLVALEVVEILAHVEPAVAAQHHRLVEAAWHGARQFVDITPEKAFF